MEIYAVRHFLKCFAVCWMGNFCSCGCRCRWRWRSRCGCLAPL